MTLPILAMFRCYLWFCFVWKLVGSSSTFKVPSCQSLCVGPGSHSYPKTAREREVQYGPTSWAPKVHEWILKIGPICIYLQWLWFCQQHVCIVGALSVDLRSCWLGKNFNESDCCRPKGSFFKARCFCLVGGFNNI